MCTHAENAGAANCIHVPCNQHENGATIVSISGPLLDALKGTTEVLLEHCFLFEGGKGKWESGWWWMSGVRVVEYIKTPVPPYQRVNKNLQSMKAC